MIRCRRYESTRRDGCLDACLELAALSPILETSSCGSCVQDQGGQAKGYHCREGMPAKKGFMSLAPLVEESSWEEV